MPVAEVAAQQTPIGVYAPGNAAVTGFSGALAPFQVAPGVDPLPTTFIDLNGPSLRVVNLQHMGGPPEAQLVGAPKTFTVSAKFVGQVFGVALDDSAPPNIYVAATSAYGLPIVAASANGQLRHIQSGAEGATFMPGLWGRQGGPGSIWKINGTDGRVTLFAEVTTGGRANSGAALGGLAYDPDSKSLYVADRETGLIHRFDLNGHDRGTYDHGVAGRAAIRLSATPWNPQPGINVKSSEFDSTNPATWGYAAPERLIYGLAAHRRRLYYAVADSLQIWSVGLKDDGSFDSDPTLEVAAPPSRGPTEISRITFDEQGRMYLAERPASTGAFDFEALTVPSIGRVLRYATLGTTASGQRIWQPVPDEYAMGFARDLRNGNGGVAIGYSYGETGNINLASCGGFMWATGEQLRNSSDPGLAAQLSHTGEVNLNGLQGGASWRIKRDSEPPLHSYFIDYADEAPDAKARGQMGDIAIQRLCSPMQPASLVPLPEALPPPAAPPGVTLKPLNTPPTAPNIPPPNPPPQPGITVVCKSYMVCGPGGNPVCKPNEIWRAASNTCESSCQTPEILVNGKCCTVSQLAPGGACSNTGNTSTADGGRCGTNQTAVGPSNFCCNNNQVYTNSSGAQACCSGILVAGKCQPPTTPPFNNPSCLPGSTNPQCCAKGYVAARGSCCLASQMTSVGTCCPSGQSPSGANKNECAPSQRTPPGKSCCAAGLVPAGTGVCCAPNNITTSGVCCPAPVDPRNRTSCPTEPVVACAKGYTKMRDGSCCNDRRLSADGKTCNVGQASCPPGQVRDKNGGCTLLPSAGSSPGVNIPLGLIPGLSIPLGSRGGPSAPGGSGVPFAPRR